MGLAAGTRLGPYEIVCPLGAGGMGEVYRARDTRLDRTVAIKVLNSTLTATPDLKARFEREAKTISQLNHPNICVLHDVGHEGNVDFLVMEFLEGESLAERIKNKGALPLAELIKIGCEVAEALDKAHRAGIVHRDLKPGNIMLTKTGAKLLDFGLAKPASMGAAAGSGSAPLLSAAMTMTSPSPQHSPLTQQGSLVGTVQYMSPEQIQGVEADARSDIFAFGAVLYEMATGRRAFEGKSQIGVASAIVEKDPEPITNMPDAFNRLVMTCLCKDPDQRFASAHDVSMQLRWISDAPARNAQSPRGTALTLAGWVVAALAAVALIISVRAPKKTGSTAGAILSFIPAPPNTRLTAFGWKTGRVVISPDGARVAFTAESSGGSAKLWVRRMNSQQATAIAGTDNAASPFWSPDGESLGFFADLKLKTVNLSSGTVSVICDVPNFRSAGAWGPDGTIIYAGQTAVMRVPSTGGTPAEAVPAAFDAALLDDTRFVFAPDGDHFLFVPFSKGIQKKVEMGSLSSHATHTVVEDATWPAIAEGRLLFVRGGKIVAQAFDAGTGKVSGATQPILDATSFSVAGGVIAFNVVSQTARMQWFDAAGQPQSVIGPEGSLCCPRISPDGQRVLYVSKNGADWDIWTIPAAGGISSRITFGPGWKAFGVWSPDGRYIAYVRPDGNKLGLYRKPADGSGQEELMVPLDSFSPTLGGVFDWSADGQYISLDAFHLPDNQWGVWIVPLFGEKKPFLLDKTRSLTFGGAFSRDKRWISWFAYEADKPQIFAAPFPSMSATYQLSTSGGIDAYWDGKNNLIYNDGYMLLAAELAFNANSLQVRSQRMMSQLPLLDTGMPRFDISADGKRVLALTPADREANSIGLLENWTSELKK